MVKDYAECFEFYRRVLAQKKNDKNKICSLHAQDVCCIAKGKDHKPYEYSTKASIVATMEGGVIVGVMSHPKMNMIANVTWCSESSTWK